MGRRPKRIFWLKKQKYFGYLIFFPYICKKMKTVLYIVLVYGVPLFIFFGVYFLVGILMKKNIRQRIRKYNDENVVSIEVSNYIGKYEYELVKLGVMAWPLFLIFCIGSTVGEEFYNIKTKKHYESRIAPWFI